MARLLIETVSITGLSVYVVILNPDGRIWNTTLNSGLGDWEAFVPGNWSQYAIPLTELTGSGIYRATYPAAIVDVISTEVLYINGTPTLGDQPQGIDRTQGVNLIAVDGDASIAPKYQGSLASMVKGAVIAGTLEIKSFSTDVVNAEVNAFQGRSVLFSTGDLAGQGGTISTFDPGTGIITVAAAFTKAPAVADDFVIV